MVKRFWRFYKACLVFVKKVWPFWGLLLRNMFYHCCAEAQTKQIPKNMKTTCKAWNPTNKVGFILLLQGSLKYD